MAKAYIHKDRKGYNIFLSGHEIDELGGGFSIDVVFKDGKTVSIMKEE